MKKNIEYQHNLSRQSPILLDYDYKKPKIDKMLAILRASGAISDDTQKHLAIDVGCSGGFFTSVISPYFEEVLGVDIDMPALKIADNNKSNHNLLYIAGDSLQLPLPDKSVDLLICNHVYEHVPDPQMMFSDILRVLKDDGVCYLGAASRWIIMEPHYHLPFLSWMPKSMANIYMRLFNRGQYYYENLTTCAGIKQMTKNFQVDDYTLKIISNPDFFHARDMIPKNGIISKIPMWVWKLCYGILPTYILILRR